MGWEVEVTDEFVAWYDNLDPESQDSITAAVEFLEDIGPSLGRPFVDTLQGCRYPNMKELRPPGGFIRVIFAFDPRRVAILLLGGDKANRWRSWYEEAIADAERLYREHLEDLKEEGLIPCVARLLSWLLLRRLIPSAESGLSGSSPPCVTF